MRLNKGLNSAKMKDALDSLPKTIAKIQNLSLPAIEIEEDSYEEASDDLQGEGVRILIPSNIIDIYTRLEIILGIKFDW